MSLLRAAAVAAGPAPHTPIRLLARSLAAMAEPLKSVDYEVFGRVQGVCFRMYTEGEAKKIGVVGWVKNTSKGTVTGQVQGPEEKVNSIAWVWRQAQFPLVEKEQDAADGKRRGGSGRHSSLIAVQMTGSFFCEAGTLKNHPIFWKVQQSLFCGSCMSSSYTIKQSRQEPFLA
ncbi:acylphosphatase-2 isoform X1 [Arvicola amphibius]|uniref:acylphosphatase-2 isoform X1 n=1 Tax=Arvicola amphibius TaxID=1047088 RepID=UPI001C08FE06|nr:acylphosphatase-2 isoform X1 [Arvicola amphibius]